ncbi:hypothetical protein ABEW81_11040 [Priestia megaterium]
MAKTDTTIELERAIYGATNKQGVFGCFEVTIGWFGNERVDYMTYDTKGVWRCYEVKVSVSDFRSKAKKTFCGHYNYFVMTSELYQKVKEEVPSHIGIYVGRTCVKRAKKQELLVEEKVLKDSLIRSLAREAGKQYKSDNPLIVDSLNRQVNQARKDAETYRVRYQDLRNSLYQKYGRNWQDVLEEQNDVANH